MFLFFVCVKNTRNSLESSTYCRIQVDVLGEFMAGIVLVNAKKKKKKIAGTVWILVAL